MAEQGTQGAGAGGAGAPGQGGQGSGAGNGGAAPANPGVATGGAAAGSQAGAAAGTEGLPLDVLPKELQGRSPQEVRFILNNMVSGFKTQRTELENLKQRLKELDDAGGAGTSGASAGGKKQEKAKESEKPLEELILEAPEDAILAVVRKHFGADLQRIESGVSTAMLNSIRSEIDDFKDYEETVTEIIQTNKLPATRENLIGAYTMAVGMKALEDRRQQKQAAMNMDKSQGAPNEQQVKEPEGLEREVMLAHGIEDAKVWNKYKSGEFEIRVPDGKKREAVKNGQ